MATNASFADDSSAGGGVDSIEQQPSRKWADSLLIIVLTLLINAGGIYWSYQASQRASESALSGVVEQIGSSREDVRRGQKAKAYSDYYAELDAGLIGVDSKGLVAGFQCPSASNSTRWHLYELRKPLVQVRVYGSPQARRVAGKLYDEYQKFISAGVKSRCNSSVLGTRLKVVSQAYAKDKVGLIKLMCEELAARAPGSTLSDCS